MSKPANPTLIGAFVLGAVVLLTAAVMLFGGEELFKPKLLLVSYFPDSVKGLREGSNVLLRGVRIGYVKNIQLQGRILPDHSLQTLVEVLMEVQPQSFKLMSDGKTMSESERRELGPKGLVDAGVRAKLGTDSLVTGQLLVELDFEPTIEAVFRAGPKSEYPEIPTIPSDVSRALEQLQNFYEKMTQEIDFDKLFKDVQGIASGLNELANSPDLRATLAGSSRFANSDLPKLATSVDRSLADLRTAVVDARTLLEHLDAGVDPLLRDLQPVVKRLDATLGDAQSALQAASQHLQQDSQLSIELRSTLDELQNASRSARVLLDYLDEHPEALLKGKTP